MSAAADRLRHGLAELGRADPELEQRLLAYLELLARWNRTYNLTSVRDPAEMVPRHLLDSLAVAPWVRGPRVVDVGSGAGLPGIPLALADPGLRVVLLEPTGKKARFLFQVIATLGLDHVERVQARAEDWSPETPFDTVVARAFGSLATLARVTAHLVAPGGRLLAMKGGRPDAELKRLPEEFEVSAVERVAVPGLGAERHVVLIARRGSRRQDR